MSGFGIQRNLNLNLAFSRQRNIRPFAPEASGLREILTEDHEPLNSPVSLSLHHDKQRNPELAVEAARRDL